MCDMPSPASCGNTYQIQWPALRPLVISDSAASYSPFACAVTKRSNCDSVIAGAVLSSSNRPEAGLRVGVGPHASPRGWGPAGNQIMPTETGPPTVAGFRIGDDRFHLRARP